MKTALKQALKAQAHHLKPVVLLGSKGLSPNLIEECHQALLAHELIKIKLTAVEKEEKKSIVEAICRPLSAECVQLIGNIAVIYRKNLTNPAPTSTGSSSLKSRSRRSDK